MKKTNPFDIFAVNTRTVYIKSLGQDVTIRPLTKAESDDFQRRLVKNYNADGTVELNLEEINEINLEKVAMCVVDPKITVKQLKEYADSVNDAIAEILEYIDGKPEDGTDAGN